MHVHDLSGRSHSWVLKNHIPKFSDTRPRSQLHLTAREILKDIYPTDPILEEVPIPGEGLYFDFYLPMRKVAVEVHGEQHFSYNSFFHREPKDFLRQRKNDITKREWCILNSITLVELPYNETQHEWINRIRA